MPSAKLRAQLLITIDARQEFSNRCRLLDDAAPLSAAACNALHQRVRRHPVPTDKLDWMENSRCPAAQAAPPAPAPAAPAPAVQLKTPRADRRGAEAD